MSVELFSKPHPAYRTLVTELYGLETGDRLYEKYAREFSASLWKDRLEWLGFGVFEHGQLRAHAVAQLVRHQPLLYIGYVEALPEPEAAQVLTRAIGEHFETRGDRLVTYLPVNLSTWHTYRFKSRGDAVLPFEPPCKPYYARLFQELYPEKELYSSYRFELPAAGTWGGVSSRYTVQGIGPDHLESELQRIYELSVCIFGAGHSTPSFEEFRAIYSGLVGTVEPRYMLVAEENGKAVGFIYALTRGPAVFVKTFGVLPEYHRHHVGASLFETICQHAREDGLRQVYGLMMKNDRLIIQLLPPGAQQVAEYVLYKGN